MKCARDRIAVTRGVHADLSVKQRLEHGVLQVGKRGAQTVPPHFDDRHLLGIAQAASEHKQHRVCGKCQSRADVIMCSRAWMHTRGV